ncbi:hypothetical protein FQZ97_897260 [compost metagenome]
MPGVAIIGVQGGGARVAAVQLHTHLTEARPILPVGAGQQRPLRIQRVVQAEGQRLRHLHVDPRVGAENAATFQQVVHPGSEPLQVQ